MRLKRWIFIAAIAVLAGITFNCAIRNSPKVLANETFALTLQVLSGKGNTEKVYARLQRIEAIVSEMSEQDRAIYNDEVNRLSEDSIDKLQNALMNNKEFQRLIQTFDNPSESSEGIESIINSFSNMFGGKN